jgi:amidase
MLARAIKAREISCVEITVHTFRRIRALNPSINAIITRFQEAALNRARLADRRVCQGISSGILHGVPFTAKDSFEVAGARTTAGVRELQDYRPVRSAAAVEGLLNAGGIIAAKTNTSAMGFDWQTYNDLFGTTKNPWNLGRTPGGSSGGCAAAVAAGMSFLSIGSDLGGSIRIPAAFCGVYGHKPSLHLVPSWGHIPPYPGTAPSRSSLGVRGPIARDAADLKLALRALVFGQALHPPRRTRISDYRIGFVLDDPVYPVSADVKNILENLVGELRRAKATLSAGWPDRRILEQRYAVYAGVQSEFGRIDSAADRLWMKLKSRLFSDQAARITARRIWQRYFQGHDVFLLPVASVAAFPHDQTQPWYRRQLQTSHGPQPYLSLSFWTSFATVAGLPATAAPAGFAGGLPVGIQIVGPYYEDLTPIEFAGRLSDLVGGFRPPNM